LTAHRFAVLARATKSTATSTKLARPKVASTTHTVWHRDTKQASDARAVSAHIVLATLAFSNLTNVR
jgi:hypothetical protein